MAENKVRWGFIGCGDVVERKSGPAFFGTDGLSVTAVMCRHKERAANFAAKHGIARHYTRAEELIRDPEVDAVYVATPPNSHAEYAIAALEAHKPVLVEKPMAISYGQCRAMIAVSERMNTPLYVAYNRRALPYFLRVKQLIDRQTLGNLLCVTLRYLRPPLSGEQHGKNYWRLQHEHSGGGYLLDMGSHQINLLQFLFGEVVAVKSMATNRGNLYEVEDTVAALLQFRSGLTATCTWCFVTSEEQCEDTIEISGERGYIRFSAFEMEDIRVKVEGAKGHEDIIQIPRPEYVQQPLIEKVNDWARDREFNPEWTQDAALTTQVIDRILNRSLIS